LLKFKILSLERSILPMVNWIYKAAVITDDGKTDRIMEGTLTSEELLEDARITIALKTRYDEYLKWEEWREQRERAEDKVQSLVGREFS
jgi:hypothetical protein